MLPATTVTFVHLHDVIEYIGIADILNEHSVNMGSAGWSDYTLVGAKQALDDIINAYMFTVARYSIPAPLSFGQIATKFSEVVLDSDYVNYEGNG